MRCASRLSPLAFTCVSASERVFTVYAAAVCDIMYCNLYTYLVCAVGSGDLDPVSCVLAQVPLSPASLERCP